MSLSLARICAARRAELDATQADVATALGISRSYYATIEAARANPSVAMVERIGEVLGIRLELTAAPTVIVLSSPRVRDSLHACCSGYVARRLVAAGWVVLREVAVEDGRLRGWIDILAYDPRTGTVLVIELKTWLDDVGRLERQVGWYARVVERVIPAEWRAERVHAWALLLASAEADEAIARHRRVLAQAFPDRAASMRQGLMDGVTASTRGLALIDPHSRRREWLIPARVDGRRTPLPYQDRDGAMRAMGL